MPNSKQIIYLSQAQYAELIANGSITVDGVTVNYDENDIYVTPQEDPIYDVKIQGSSIVNNQGVANLPIANSNNLGLVKQGSNTAATGILIDQNGIIKTESASVGNYKGGDNDFRPVTTKYQDRATFYGLAKIAGHDEKNSTESVGTYTPEAKGAIQKMLGVSDLIATEENDLVASKAYAIGDVFTANGKLYKATAAIAADAAIIPTVEGEEIEGANCEEVTVADEFVKKTDIGSNITAGILRVGSGLYLENSITGQFGVYKATSAQIKQSVGNYNPIVPAFQSESTFYGLAKAAGADEKDSTLPVGQYTDTAKSAIREMLDTISINDIVSKYDSTTTYQKGDYCEYEGKIYFAKVAITTAEEWIADHWTETTLTTYANSQLQRPGIIGITPVWSGVLIDNTGALHLNMPNDTLIKAGNDTSRAILIAKQHMATFYGLAKASGDTTQSASSNAVGVYTDNAKASIKAMLGIQDGSTGTVDVTDTTPTITAVENTRYVCGEVTSLSFTPPASGISIVRFTSGSSVTVLTIPSTVKFPEWFDPTSLETNTIYEICITDGVYGAVMSWAL